MHRDSMKHFIRENPGQVLPIGKNEWKITFQYNVLMHQHWRIEMRTIYLDGCLQRDWTIFEPECSIIWIFDWIEKKKTKFQ